MKYALHDEQKIIPQRRQWCFLRSKVKGASHE